MLASVPPVFRQHIYPGIFFFVVILFHKFNELGILPTQIIYLWFGKRVCVCVAFGAAANENTIREKH